MDPLLQQLLMGLSQQPTQMAGMDAGQIRKLPSIPGPPLVGPGSTKDMINQTRPETIPIGPNTPIIRPTGPSGVSGYDLSSLDLIVEALSGITPPVDKMTKSENIIDRRGIPAKPPSLGDYKQEFDYAHQVPYNQLLQPATPLGLQAGLNNIKAPVSDIPMPRPNPQAMSYPSGFSQQQIDLLKGLAGL